MARTESSRSTATSNAPPRSVGWADLSEHSLPSPLPAWPDWVSGLKPIAANNCAGTKPGAGAKPFTPMITIGSNRQLAPLRWLADATQPQVSGDLNQVPGNTHAAHNSKNHPRFGKVSSLGPRHKSMLQECFSDCSSSNLSRHSSLSSNRGNPIESETLFQTAARLKATPTYRTADGATIRFPQYAAHQLICFSDPEEIQAVLGDLLDFTVKRQISDEWITGMVLYPPLLKAVFRVMDAVVPITKLLLPKSVCARVLESLLTKFPARFILSQLAGRSLDIHGAVGIRYIIRRSRSTAGTLKTPPGEEFLVAAGAIHHAYGIIQETGLMPAASVQVIRLVECALHGITSLEQLHVESTREFVKATIRLLKRKIIRRPGEKPEVDPARRVAALHLISTILRTYKRLMESRDEEWDTPGMSPDDWLLQDLSVYDVYDYLRAESADQMVRCMALRVIRDFAVVDIDAVASWGPLGDIVGICVDVLLWKTDWQQGHTGEAKSLEIVKFNPLDDAYCIIALSPPQLTIAAMSKALTDKHWPSVLSMLLQSGLFSFLQNVLEEPFTTEGDSFCRSTCRTKTDACICLTRCLEQVTAKDMKMLPTSTCKTLKNLAQNEDLPLNLREVAVNGTHALNDTLGPLIVHLRSALPRRDSSPNSTTDSTSTSPRPNSNFTGSDQASD
ncbi:hypothetical protein FRC01_008702 [Tulasnella sp. 417]|nr:hypothetical protein FRC01_008702 [Tulasnella sp. 417]